MLIPTRAKLASDGPYPPGRLGTLRFQFTIGQQKAHARRPARLSRYALDLTPVTNAEFARFLIASGYRPLQPENFLKHWGGTAPPPGLEEHPVVYVDLDDARAYAAWAGKQLPTELEWQYAAEGPSRLAYPWGEAMKPGCCNGGETGGRHVREGVRGGTFFIRLLRHVR